MYQFQQKLKFIKEKVKQWNKESFGNIFQEKRTLEKAIEDIQAIIMESRYTEDLKSSKGSILGVKREGEVIRDSMEAKIQKLVA